MIKKYLWVFLVSILLSNAQISLLDSSVYADENEITLENANLQSNNKNSRERYGITLEANKIYKLINFSEYTAYVVGDTFYEDYEYVGYYKDGRVIDYGVDGSGSFVIYPGGHIIIKTKSIQKFSWSDSERIMYGEVKEDPLKKKTLKSGYNYRIQNISDSKSLKLVNYGDLYTKSDITYYSVESGYENGDKPYDGPTLIDPSRSRVEIAKDGHALVQVNKGKNLTLYYPKELESQMEIIQYKGNMPTINTITTSIECKSKFDPLKIVKANDKEDGNLTNKIKVIENTVNSSKIGEYKVIYSVTDSDKNTEQITVKIKVLAPLKKVSSLKIVNTNYNSNKISWSKVNDSHGYRIYRSTSKKGTYSSIKIISNGKTLSYTNTGLETGKTYYYKVRAYREGVDGKKVYGDYSPVISAKPMISTPSVTLTSGSKKAIVKWSKVSGASGYKIYRATSKTGQYSSIKDITKGSTISYTNNNLKSNKGYYYKVRAYRTVNGKKVYSAYSSIKYIKVK